MSSPEPSLPALIGRLKDDAIELVRAEISLARAQLLQRLGELRGALAPAALALAVLHAGVLAVGAALVLWIGEALGGRYAASAAGVGAVFLVSAGALAWRVARKVEAAARADALTVPGKFAVEVVHERTKRG